MIRPSLTELTHEIARTALALHRLAMTVDEVQDLKSPVTSSRPEDGVPRPTEDAALCPRRNHVSDTVRLTRPQLDALSTRLTRALDVWEGRTAP